MFEFIEKYRPYFFSLREDAKYVFLDLAIPINWDLSNIKLIIDVFSGVNFNLQDTDGKVNLVSFYIEINPKNYNTLFECVAQVLKFNKEIEEKDRLLKEKILELESLFNKEPLHKLKEITFISGENEKKPRVVGKRTRKGSEVSGESETEISERTEENT